MIKKSQVAGLAIMPSVFVFYRFLLGFLCILVLFAAQRKFIKVKNLHYLIGRTLANCCAVYCFFKAVGVTSVAQANILNMTYPLFVAVFSWFLFREERSFMTILIVLTAFAGVWLIVNPGQMSFQIQSLWGLASGISAAFAIIYLNLSQRVHDTETTLFFLFGLGGLLIFLIFHQQMRIPENQEWLFILLCSGFSIVGQYLITLGFNYISAVEGSIISSTRILLAALLGPFIASDPWLSFNGWIGALLIFGANVYLALRAAGKPENPVENSRNLG